MKTVALFAKSGTILFLIAALGCQNQPSNKHLQMEADQAQLEANIELYKDIWVEIINGRKIEMINTDSFGENVTVLATADGDIVGMENFKGYYNNYLTGFSDAEFTIVDAFGQGNKIVQHWNFKGTHDDEFFGVPANGKTVDISGTTLVEMKDGEIATEQDFMDLLDFYTQLGLM